METGELILGLVATTDPRMCGARRPGIATIIRLGEMVDVETLRDLWESDLARAGWDGRDADEWDQVPIPIIRSDPETTWIWSDLHLGDPSVISVFGRPFIEVGAMNAFLLGEWRDRVQAGHTIICLGDVLHEDVWRNESLMNEIRSCPGDRILVLGNHDGNAHGLRLLGFTVQHTLALCATDPPLALSHEPLRQVPLGAICVHGHLHEGTEPTVRHINLTVEQTLYGPVRLARVVEQPREREWTISNNRR